MSDNVPQFLLTLACPDRMGIVAEVSRFLVVHYCNIVESAQFEDPVSQRFFCGQPFVRPKVRLSRCCGNRSPRLALNIRCSGRSWRRPLVSERW